MSRIVAAGLFLSLCAGTTRAQTLPLPKEKERWVRTSVDGQEIYSNASERETLRVAKDLQGFRQTIAAITRLKTDDPLPRKIFIFRDRHSYAPFRDALTGRRSDNVAGLFLAHTNGNFIAVRADGDDNAIVYHELVHSFVRNTMSAVPSWLNEGLAEYYSTFRRSGDDAVIGEPADHHIRLLLATALTPVDDFFASSRSTRESRDGVREGMFYAQSWLFMHYLLAAENDRSEALVNFLQALDRGVPADAAFRESFGMSLEQLRLELYKYVRRKTFPIRRVHLPDLQPSPVPRPAAVSRADLLANLGELLAHSGSSTDAERFLEAALEIDPTHPVAHASLGLVRHLHGDPAAAAAHFRSAVRSPAATAMHHLLAAEHLMRGWPEGTGVEPANAREVRAELKTAVAANPNLARAWALLGTTHLAGGDAAEGIAALEKSWSLRPSQPEIAYGLVVLHARLGNRSAAERWMRTLDRIGAPEQITAAQNAIATISITEADRLARAGRLGEAVASLESAAGAIADPALKSEIAQRIENLRRTARHNEATARYNAAVSLANTGKTTRAIAALDEIIASDADADIISAARKLRAKLKK